MSQEGAQPRELFSAYKVKGGSIIMLSIDGRGVGMLNLIPNPQYPGADFITNFLINEKYRNKGYGTKLLQFALTQCRKRYQVLELDLANPLAQSLYERNGFVAVERLVNILGPYLVMRRDSRPV